MEKLEYKKMYEMEEKYWWFVARRKFIPSIINDFVGSTANTKILDVGCGTGINLLEFEKLGFIIGCDNSKQAIKFFRAKDKKTIILSDASFLALGQYFNIILALDVLEHCKDEKKAIKEFYRVLKSNGILIVTVPAIKFLFGRHDKILHHFRRYSKKELESKLTSNGFKIEKISYWCIFPFPLVFLYRLFTKYYYKKRQSDSTPSFLNKPLLLLLSIEEKIIKHFSFPIFGTSLVCVARRVD
ncbi:MAG: class I SAM-dependent methyltransferase [Candidatus Aenigmarchaeota archaeon]|nr:class I SAM-dependent methyltransferase [Candidatus Aenigmarchaeota archaeon]